MNIKKSLKNKKKPKKILTSDKKAPTQHNANRFVFANKFHTCVLIWLILDFLVVDAESMVSILTGSISFGVFIRSYCTNLYAKIHLKSASVWYCFNIVSKYVHFFPHDVQIKNHEYLPLHNYVESNDSIWTLSHDLSLKWIAVNLLFGLNFCVNLHVKFIQVIT